MSISITMPRLSDTMQQGTVVKWNVKEGQQVKSGDVIADIETDKATMELQTFDDGTIASLGVSEGQTVAVGTVIAVLAEAGEDASKIKASAGGAAPAKSVKAEGAGSSNAGGSSGGAGSTAVIDRPTGGTSHTSNGVGHGTHDRVFASPLAKKIAEESGIDLASLEGSGPGGRIVRKDVEEAIRGGVGAKVAPGRGGGAAPAPSPAFAPGAPVLAARTVTLSNMRRVIATRLVESKQTIPHYQVTVEVEMDALLALRQQLNEQLATQNVKLSVNDFLVRACALAMHEHPFVNSRWVATKGQESIEILGEVNVGVAIALDEAKGGGLVVATIRNADAIGLRQISSQTKQLADKARAKGLSPQEMEGATFTISNLGMFGVDHFTAIINPPNVAILAVGAALDKPIVKNGTVVPAKVMSMTMSSDHRVVDGAMAAKYLATVKSMLEKPASLLV
ncbi:MAG: 2-oxo acid dehydrogenase subunit E2 [Phycisphaerales bacterium]|nr:MAG: 2-oxo acid dehydrogenase subunit E2 [Phycisphaerales bacterium]